MDDHETFLLLAARSTMEPLSRDEASALEAHLAACPSCRSAAAAMRRDDIRLRAALGPVAVAPRVRERVLGEAAGSNRRVAGRILLVLAATLGLALVGLPLISGRPVRPVPSVAPSASVASVVPTPSVATVSPTATPEPSPSVVSSPTASSSAVVPAGSVNGAFTYSEFEPRRGSISARLVDGKPQGAWSRTLTGDGRTWSGTITCLVVDDDEAWMAGPVTDSPGGAATAVFIMVRDRGPGGEGDRAMMDLSNRGETLDLFEGWCRGKFRPDAPYPVTSGDIRIDPR